MRGFVPRRMINIESNLPMRIGRCRLHPAVQGASTMSPCKWRIRSIIEMRSGRATWDAVG